MTENFERKNICKGVNFNVVRDEKFKRNQLVVNFLVPLKRETASLNSLLPLVMRHSCREYPDMTALNSKLKSLYGANIDGGASKIGEVQVITLFCGSIEDRYAFDNEKVLFECAKLLNSVIFEPAFENGTFKSSEVEIEKHNLSDLIDSMLNDKRMYASARLKEEMCKNEAYGVREFGEKSLVEKITPESLTKQWKKVIETAKVEIMLIGSGDSEETEKLFADNFKKIDRSNLVETKTSIKSGVENVKTIVERLPVAQSKLVMGFRAGNVNDKNTSAMRLVSAILGGSTQSKLFMNVREKMSLCYYCAAALERHKSLLFIDSGIEEKNYEKARDEIINQINDIKAGKFTEDEMNTAKLSLQNSFWQVADSGYSLAVYYLGHSLSGKIISPKQAAADIMKVSRDEVIKAANELQLDTIYLLCSNEDGEKVND